MNHNKGELSLACQVFEKRVAEAGKADSRRFAGIPVTVLRLARQGVGPDKTVLFQGQQCAEATTLFWACMVLGAIFVPIDWQWPAYLVRRAAGMLRPVVVIAAETDIDALGQVYPESVAVSIEEVRGWRGSDLAAYADPVGSFDPQSAAVYLFTSGSTGVPKAVVLSRAALANGAAVTLDAFDWQPGERLLNLPELHTMSGLRNALVAAPIGGVDWLPSPIVERGNIFDLIDVIGASACNHLVAGPALIKQLLLVGDRLAPDVFQHMLAIYCTGAALSPAAVEAFYIRHGVPIINYYGLTETGGICISQDRKAWDRTDRSLGRAVGCQARLVAAAGGEGSGELQVRSPQLMTGYLGEPERTMARFDGEWLRTGDIMRQDSAGRFHLLGRTDLFIKTASTDRVHPEEIEAAVEEHPAVAEAAACGRVDADGNERLVVLAVLHQPAAVGDRLDVELARFVAERVGPARKPGEVVFVGKLPRLPGGKLDRPALKDMLP